MSAEASGRAEQAAQTTQSAQAAPRLPADRDLSIDAARILSLLLVALIHLLMIGARVTPEGVEMSRPLEAQSWFAPLTWVGQIMPLFFIVGGYTGIRSWRSATGRGDSWWGYVRGRVLRLARPALPFFVFWLAVLVVGRLVGIDAALLDGIAVGAGSPLWFLAAFLLAQSLVPWFTRWHERSRRGALLSLGAAAVLVDAAAQYSGLPGVRWLNFAFVWLFVQQLGFLLLDGSLTRLRERRGGVLILLGIAAVAYLLLWAGVAAGWHSPDMLQNLNPPTVSLALLGVAQLALFELTRPALRALMRVRPVQVIAFLVGSRAMTVYLWHLPVIIALTGLGLLIPGAAPDPASPAWWATRPLYYVAAVAAVVALGALLGRFEQIPDALTSRSAAPAAAVAAAVLTFAAAFWVTVSGLGLVTAAFGTLAVAAAVFLSRGRISS